MRGLPSAQFERPRENGNRRFRWSLATTGEPITIIP